MPTLNLPVAGGKLAPYTTKPPRHLPAAKPPFSRIAYAAAHVVADPLADGDPWLDSADRLGAHHRVPPAPVVARARRRRGHGHRPARHGRRLADLARIDPQEPRRREGFSRRAGRLRRRHRSSRTERRRDHRRRHPRLRGAMRRDRKTRRPHRADGKPRAGEGGAQRRRLRQGLWPHSQPGEGAGDHPLARRDVRSRTRRLLGPPRPQGGDGPSPST